MGTAAVAAPVLMSNVAPWAIESAKYGIDGVNVRLIKALSQRSGVPLVPTVVPTARHLAAFKGRQDAYSLSLATNLSDEDGAVVGRVATYPVVLVAMATQPMANYEDFVKSSNRGVGVLRALKYEPLSSDSRVSKVDIATLESGLRMLVAGRLDAVVATLPAIQYQLRSMGGTASPNQFLRVSESTWVLRARPQIDMAQRAQLAQALAEMMRDGTVERIVTQFLQEPVSVDP